MADENRKLAAIMSADVVGYSRLMAADEAATVKTLKEYRALIAGVVERHKGRVVNAPGDNMLSEFPSAVEAVEAAYEIQQVLKGRNLERPAEGRMDFRIGLNLGDVIEEDDGTIYGDGVNIAARMEPLADTGGICISNTIFEAVEGKLDFGFDFLGAQQVKNIDRPINVYRVLSAADAAKARQAKTPSRHLPVPVVVGVAAVLIVLVGIGGWWFASREDAPQMVTADGSTTDDPTLAMPTGPAIAVLPFENLSDNSDQNYFAVGLTEDVINRLSEFPRFHVLGRNSTTQYDDKSTDIRKISAELGARYLIQGGVRKADTEVRVTVQLLRGADGTQIWANTYDRSLSASNLFEIMDEITAQIASTIASDSGIITRTELKNIRGKPPATLEAYECELRLNAYYDVPNPDEHAMLRDCAERAIEPDPEHPLGWVIAAWIYMDEERFGFNTNPGAMDRALLAAEQIVKLDANDYNGQWALGDIYFHRHEMDKFFTAAERAIERNPNNATILSDFGNSMIFAGHYERGVALLRKAMALDPNYPQWLNYGLSVYYYEKGDYQKALDTILKITQSDWYWLYVNYAAIYGQLGRQEEARDAVDKLNDLYPDFGESHYDEAKIWNLPDEIIEHYAEGLRKAGLYYPDRPPLTD